MALQVLIDGLGLMGGSLAAALTRTGASVWCHHRRFSVAQAAADKGWGQAVANLEDLPPIDVAVTCVPVSVVAERVRALHVALPQAVISDVGSTKGGICAQLSDLERVGAFVGSHPMCGSHAQGLDHARADLYQGATVVVCPAVSTPTGSTALIDDLWTSCGARVIRLDPDSHDQAVAAASHLPHILAAQAARHLNAQALPLAASGFRDTTRVAAGSPNLWTDILRENRLAILSELRQAQDDLSALAQALDNDDEATIKVWLEAGQLARQRYERHHANGAD